MAKKEEQPISPLSIPLEKAHTEIRETDLADIPQKKITQKEFLKIIYKQVDEKIENHKKTGHSQGYLKAVLLALLFAPFLFKAGADIYDMAKPHITELLGIPAPQPEKETAVPSAGTGNGNLAKALAEQNSAFINKLTKLMAMQEKKSFAKLNKLIEAKVKTEAFQKVIIVRNDSEASFSFKLEKKLLFELSGLDMDDPITGAKLFKKIKSVELLIAMVDSFNRMLLNASQHKISEFHVKNAVEGKRQTLKRLQELK